MKLFNAERIENIFNIPLNKRKGIIDNALNILEPSYYLQLSALQRAHNIGQYASTTANISTPNYIDDKMGIFDTKYTAMLDLHKAKKFIYAPEPEPIIKNDPKLVVPKTILDEPVTVLQDIDNSDSRQEKMIAEARHAAESAAVPKERAHELVA